MKVLGVDSKAEICQLCNSVVEEDVGQFEVPVHDVSGCQVFQSLVDVPYIGPGIIFRHGPPFFDQFFHGALLAEFSDEIAVVDALQDFVAANAVGMI